MLSHTSTATTKVSPSPFQPELGSASPSPCSHPYPHPSLLRAAKMTLEYSSNGVSLLFPVTSNCIQQGTPNTLGWPTASYTHSRAFQWPLPCILFALFPPASTPASSAIWPSAIVLSSAPSHPAGSHSILCFWMTSHFSLWLIFLQFFCSCLIHPLIFFLFFLSFWSVSLH